jgi:threonine aldolase
MSSLKRILHLMGNLPGVARRQVTFLVLPRKVTKRRRAHYSWAAFIQRKTIVIDLRSDTVTRPTSAMLAAMMAAQVGDDVWGDDPTVLKLQTAVAQQAGKEAALFFPSGTQSNLAALMAHCERGDEYIVGQLAHTYKYEGGGAAVLGSIVPQPIEHAQDGSLPLDKIAAAIKHHGPGLGAHFARTRLLALENTFNGKVLPEEYVRSATQLARERGLATHLDGARVANAAVASKQTLAQLCAPFDSASICFSKGLGTPVGSVLVGNVALIERAYRWRKVLGGGMRQSGFLAAACLYALNHHWQRLEQDHANAARLAAGLSGIAQVKITGQSTNMVFAQFPQEHCAPLEHFLKERGILTQMLYASRFVTHLDVSEHDIDAVIAAIKQYFSKA